MVPPPFHFFVFSFVRGRSTTSLLSLFGRTAVTAAARRSVALSISFSLWATSPQLLLLCVARYIVCVARGAAAAAMAERTLRGTVYTLNTYQLNCNCFSS